MAVNEARVLAAIREQRPLVHCLTNAVTIERVADGLAAVGALPVMASAVEEAAEMAAHAQAVVLNLGTPTPDRFAAAALAGQRARGRGIPVVMDPVGCGSTAWRTQEMRTLARRVQPSVVRGNAPEVAALADLPTPAALRGVTAERDMAPDAFLAQEAAGRLGGVVLVTGAVDLVVDDKQLREHHTTGAPVLGRVIGAGDLLTALVAACCAVQPEDAFASAWSGLIIFRLAVDRAEGAHLAPGSFWVRLIDALASLGPSEMPRSLAVAEAP